MGFKDNKYRIFLSFDFALLFVGMIYGFLGVYANVNGGTENTTRVIIGAVCVAAWYILLPSLDRDKKDKIANAIAIHSLCSIIVVAIIALDLKYFLNNLSSGKWYLDVLCCIGGIFAVAYLVYVFVGVMKTFYSFVEKVRKFIFPSDKQVNSGLVNIFKGISASILALTSFGASVFGLIEIAKKISEALLGL